MTTSIEATFLTYAAARAGLELAVDDTTGTVVIVCDPATAADLAERVLRTTPLRGNAEAAPSPVTLPTAVMAALGSTPHVPPYPGDRDTPRPRVTVDPSLALVPATGDVPTGVDTRDPAACTCMTSVLTCQLHAAPRPATLRDHLRR